MWSRCVHKMRFINNIMIVGSITLQSHSKIGSFSFWKHLLVQCKCASKSWPFSLLLSPALILFDIFRKSDRLAFGWLPPSLPRQQVFSPRYCFLVPSLCSGRRRPRGVTLSHRTSVWLNIGSLAEYRKPRRMRRLRNTTHSNAQLEKRQYCAYCTLSIPCFQPYTPFQRSPTFHSTPQHTSIDIKWLPLRHTCNRHSDLKDILRHSNTNTNALCNNTKHM